MEAPKEKRTRSGRRGAPARTAEAREGQLISLAYDLVEKKLSNGTATSQETTHFLKLGSVKAQLELEKLRQENKLLEARTEALESAKRIEELYKAALSAMRSYQGSEESEEFDD